MIIVRAIAVMFFILFSGNVAAHGSSHPSCAGILKENDPQGYSACVDRLQRISDECTASPICAREREAQRYRDKRYAYFMIVLITLAVVLVILS